VESRTSDAIYRGNLDKLLAKVAEEHGFDLAQYRPRYVERRLAARLRTVGVHTYRQYARYLDAHPEEYPKLLDALMINVTQFFRDPVVWDLLAAHVVPALLDDAVAHRRKTIRVWSAGCASGEEPYSIAMMFLAALDNPAYRDIQLHVNATDLDRDALATAERGEYPAAHAQKIPVPMRERYVTIEGDRMLVNPEVRSRVRFGYLSLFEDAPIQIVDVVFCRNVFIYFNRDEQDRMLRSFSKALARGGYLVLGRSERVSPGLASEFELVSSRERIYRHAGRAR
jgi:two-component system CheB/CheR fusion protein